MFLGVHMLSSGHKSLFKFETMVDFSFLINHFCVIGHRSVNVNQIFHYLRHILSLASVPFIPLNDLFIQISSLLTTNLHTLTRRNYSTYSSICNVSYAHTQRTACAATICCHGNTSTPPQYKHTYLLPRTYVTLNISNAADSISSQQRGIHLWSAVRKKISYYTAV